MFPHSTEKLHPLIGEEFVGHGAYAGTAIGHSGWGSKMRLETKEALVRRRMWK
jgi:hypothetical protein